MKKADVCPNLTIRPSIFFRLAYKKHGVGAMKHANRSWYLLRWPN